MSLDAHSAYAEDEACSMSGDSAVQDDHPDRRFHVAKCWNSAGAPCCHRWDEPWARLFPRAECDRHLDTSVMQAALTVKGSGHKEAVVSSYSGWLHISSMMQPRTRGVDTGERTIRNVGECGALDSAAYSFGVLTWKTATHLRDALPCVFAKAESINNPEDMAHPSGAVLMHYEIPAFELFYLDMNGIIHVCSHPNDDDPHFRNTEERIFWDIFNYINFVFRMIKLMKTFFMAVDGVAPRPKITQQRGRIFKSAKEAQAQEKEAREKGVVLPTEEWFDSNCISAGTEFMARLQDQLQQFVAAKVSSDPLWPGVNVYLSGHQTPDEEEHNKMNFIRTERSWPGRKCSFSFAMYFVGLKLSSWCVSLQIMLGKCSPEPHFALLREEIVYGKRQNQKRLSIPEEITFHCLHLSLLREFLELEFQELKKTIPFEFKMDNIIDDWVLMCFLVANDFLSHLPNLYFAHNALSVLYQAYIYVMPSLGGLLEKFSHLDIPDFDSNEDQEGLLEMEFRQHKRYYYVNKLENSDVNKQFMQEQAHGYVWAIQWNLHYYYNDVQSWNWFYPHHYSPYISDIKDFQNMDMTLELDKPFLPFQQLKPSFLQPVKSWCPSPIRKPRRNPASTMAAHVHVVQHCSEADLCTAGDTAAHQSQMFY
ncbi:hypothetical protein MRX96_013570 [Rhipicephalus microplus]